MTFDHDIPIPDIATKYDFSDAKPGASKLFRDRKECTKFQQAIRRYIATHDLPWGTETRAVAGGIRLWITEREAVPEPTVAPVEPHRDAAQDDELAAALRIIQARAAGQPPSPRPRQYQDEADNPFDVIVTPTGYGVRKPRPVPPLPDKAFTG